MTEYGSVRPSGREAVIAVRVAISCSGLSAGVEVEAVIDTGFTGYLTLPPELIGELGFPESAMDFVEVELANGSTDDLEVYEACVLWHAHPHPVTVYVSGGSPLVGMSLLRGSRLTIEAAPGGEVVIEEMGNR